MDLIIFGKPTEFYAGLLMQNLDDDTNILCFKDAPDHLNRAKKLVMYMKYKGYELNKCETLKEFKTNNGNVLHNIICFRLSISPVLKKIKTKLNKDKEIKWTKQIGYSENGKMIHLTKETLAFLISIKAHEKEDYNDVIMRLKK